MDIEIEYGGIEITEKHIESRLLVYDKTNKKMDINITNDEHGLTVHLQGKKYNLIFPKNIWKNLPVDLKDFFTQEFGFISTAPMPLVSEIDELHYTTPPPIFEDHIKDIILHQIPGIADDYSLNTAQTIQRFRNINYSFTGTSNYNAEANAHDGAVLLLSCGKDSLLTLGLARELDLQTKAIHINDTTTPYENHVSLETIQKVAKNQKINIEVITNNIEKLNDFETWDKSPTCLGYSHMITGFCFLAIPFLHNDASMVLLGNQQNMNFPFQTRQGYTGYASYDQTTAARNKQQSMLQHLNKHYQVLSLIEPLTDLAETKILFSRYPELAQYEFSCNCLYDTNEKRWCHACNKCARLNIFMLAHDINPKNVGLNNMLSRRFIQYYRLFGVNPDVDRYEKCNEARDQQLLAFYMAYKNGVKGQLIDLFKKDFLSEAMDREDELRKTFFKIYPTDLPNNLKTRLHGIFKEELEDLQ
jgi:hypothetical protein